MNFKLMLIAATVAAAGCSHQAKEEEAVNDSNTPLHLLQPDYVTPYGIPEKEDVQASMKRILAYLDATTPMRVVDKNTGEVISDYSAITPDAQLERGTFRLTSYEWGVLYSAMLAASEATGDPAYRDYAVSRMNFLSELAPHFARLAENGAEIDPLMHQVVASKALDDAGAICSAMIKAQAADSTLNYTGQIARYMDFIENKEHRLADGTYARLRPHVNTVWLDDMFMAVPSIADYSLLAGDKAPKYQDEAVRQINQFHQRMWVPEKKLFRHGWVEDMEEHPSFHWARANGWALLTMTEVLDVLPDDHPQRPQLLEKFKAHVAGLVPLQGIDGFWHQLLDRNETYPETSATAIYTYCLAHAINKGWIDAKTYGPAVQLAWNAVASKINDKGQVEGTCVGTGMGYDPAFYAYRPVSAYAAHGYGPSLWAAAEMVTLLENQHPKLNDSGVQYYRNPQTSDEPIFYTTEL